MRAPTDKAPPIVRERGILFSAPMIRALCAGLKTQTRRIIRSGVFDVHPDQGGYAGATRVYRDGGSFSADFPDGSSSEFEVNCPYGGKGARLWVRETFALVDGPYCYEGPPSKAGEEWFPIYRADDDVPSMRWHPAIFMPRWASRITLEITDVRIERVQDLSEEDAKAEGITEPAPVHGEWCDPAKGREGHWSYRKPYADLWDEINGRGSWSTNPWVWVVTFKRIEGDRDR